MKLSNLKIPFDAFERNKKVASLLQPGETVLDVGGGVTGIKLFGNNPVKIADLEVGDFKGDASNLNLPAKSFDVVVSVDTLEHIPPKDRVKFVKNLKRIAKKRVVISAPYGSRSHVKAEKDLLKKLNRIGKKDFFLEQHVEFVLPKPEQVADIKATKTKVIYSGNFKFSNLLFRFQSYESGILIWDKLMLIVRDILNILLNTLLYPFWFYEKPSERANRFYLIIEK